MSNGLRSDSGSGGPHTKQSEVQLSRYDDEWWTLSDGRGVIMATAETLVEVKQ